MLNYYSDVYQNNKTTTFSTLNYTNKLNLENEIQNNKKKQEQINQNSNKNGKIIGNNNNKNEKKEGPEDSIPQKKTTNNINDDKINEYINEVLVNKNSKLLTDSQYVSLENNIGENSCFVNVIIHFLYIFPCVNDYLIKKYNEKVNENNKKEQKNKNNENKEVKEQKENKENIQNQKNEIINVKSNEIKNNKKNELKKEDDYNQFLFFLGETLNEYQNILSSNDNKNKIIKLKTIKLRKSLSEYSNNLFKLNNISDPIEFLIYILDLINKKNSEEIHKYFHLKLIEEIRCSNFCSNKSNKKYDKDNFIYQIYIEDIFNYIKNAKINFEEYKQNLFMLSYYSTQNEFIKCEKCKSTMNKTIICNNEPDLPKILLINCVWNNAKPDLEEVINLLFLISFKEDLDNLFICPNQNHKNDYYLMGIIFYSYTLCHYINMIFNVQKNVFTLYNDEAIIEFNTILELYNYLTVEQLKTNSKAFFYPVLLVYGKENIYDAYILSIIEKIDINNYKKLVEECNNEIKKNKVKEKPLTEEEKKRNYDELVLAQIRKNREDREKEINKILKKNDNNFNYKKNNFIENNKKLNIINEKKSENTFLKSANNFNNKKQKDTRGFSVGNNNKYSYLNSNNNYFQNYDYNGRLINESSHLYHNYNDNKDYLYKTNYKYTTSLRIY